jgi:hypothetical protein
LDYPGILGVATVCKLWNTFSKNPVIWQRLFIEEGIPFVQGPDGKLLYSEREFKMLYGVTFGLKMSERFFGKVDRKEMPTIHWTWFEECFKKDSFGSGEVRNNYKFVVVPAIFERVAGDEFPYVLDENENLSKAPRNSDEWKGKTLQISNTVKNFKILCKNPLAGRENTPVFRHFDDDVLKQCNTRANKIRVFFIRRCIADETRSMPYLSQEALVKERGFEVIPLLPRMLFDAVCILTSGTCTDARTPRCSYARTPDIIVVGNNIFQPVIGGFALGSGADVDITRHDDDRIGVVPGGPAEVRRPPALGALELDKGH